MIDVSPCPQAPGERFDLGLADLGPTKKSQAISSPKRGDDIPMVPKSPFST